MNVLITGGGCSEKIDDVRSITNFSSGKTALSIAKTIQDMDPAAAIDFLLAESAVQPKAADNVTVQNFPPLYILVYFAIFLIPEPNSSARPISLKKFAIFGFLGYGE